jgi:hypothetical protein
MTKSVVALVLMAAIVAAAHISPALGRDKDQWKSGTNAVLFLTQHFEQVPWLSAWSPQTKIKTDLLIGPKVETMEALRFTLPQTQFSNNAGPDNQNRS